MRPTNLNFRSPREKSGDYVIPLMHYDGKSMNYIKMNATSRLRSPEENKRFTTFSGQDRFSYTKVWCLIFCLIFTLVRYTEGTGGPSFLRNRQGQDHNVAHSSIKKECRSYPFSFSHSDRGKCQWSGTPSARITATS